MLLQTTNSTSLAASLSVCKTSACVRFKRGSPLTDTSLSPKRKRPSLAATPELVILLIINSPSVTPSDAITVTPRLPRVLFFIWKLICLNPRGISKELFSSPSPSPSSSGSGGSEICRGGKGGEESEGGEGGEEFRGGNGSRVEGRESLEVKEGASPILPDISITLDSGRDG